jgi:hypothetical protein
MNTAVATFPDPATGQAIQVIPKEGEAPSDAITRVKKAHGANPDLGDYQHVHDVYVAIADSLLKGDKQQAQSKIKELARMLNEPLPEPVTPEALDQQKEDRIFNEHKNLATQRQNYMDSRFTRTPPSKPEVPEPTSFDQFFSAKG